MEKGRMYNIGDKANLDQNLDSHTHTHTDIFTNLLSTSIHSFQEEEKKTARISR